MDKTENKFRKNAGPNQNVMNSNAFNWHPVPGPFCKSTYKEKLLDK